MTDFLTRRTLLQLAAAQGGVAALGLLPALAQAPARDSITIAYPNDLATWDPNAALLAVTQSLYKCVFDSPVTQAPDLSVRPNLVKAWRYRDAKSLELELDLQENALFHNGDPVTSADLRYTFFERPRAPVPEGKPRLPIGFVWRRLKDIEIVSPLKAVMIFAEPMPSAVSWLGFLMSFVVPKSYMEKVGAEAFATQPIGSGPYRLVNHERGARIELAAFDKYWGGAPKIKHVTIEILRDPVTRVAAIQSHQVDLAVDLPIREVTRLGAEPGLVGKIYSIADITVLQVTNKGPFEQEAVRVAAHHAIDKKAISRALFTGKATLIDVPAARGTPGYPKDFSFAYDPGKATALLKQAGFSPANPAKIGFATTKGTFPNDFEMAQAIAAMWKKVGIEAEIQVIEPAQWTELLHANKLPEATLYSWGNATGDPEMYAGSLLDPKAIYSAFKSDDLGKRIAPLLVETDQEKRYAGYREFDIYSVEKGFIIPLYQAIKTVAYQSRLGFTAYENGWILPQAYTLKA
jgi:peptide/nickel transport system substrate-binding protein